MKKILSLTLMLAATTLLNAQVGTMFPELEGETLNEKTISVTKDCKGKTTLICLAYSKKAEEDLQTWMSPLYNKFVAKTGLMDGEYDVNLYFIPMFTGMNQPTEGMAKKQIKEGTDRKYYNNIICYRGSIKPYKESLNLQEKDKPYFFILDSTGKVIYATSGVFTESKMEAIEDKLE